MEIGVIVQARMGSRRLPGKVLRRAGGKPMIAYLLESLSRCTSAGRTLVATSTEKEDDPLSDYCRDGGVPCFRGSLEDVAGRFRGAMEAFGLDAFVRVNGDSPLLDHRLVDRAADLFREGGRDLVTNVLVRTFPKGQSVEAVGAGAFRTACGRMTTAEEREHVTRHFYLHAGDYRLFDFKSDDDFGRVQMSVDTPEDMTAFETLAGKLERPHWEYGWRELLRLREGAA